MGLCQVRVGSGWGVGEGVETAYVMKPSATSGAARRLLGSSKPRRSRASEDDPYSSADERSSRHYYSRTRRTNNLSQPTYTPRCPPPSTRPLA